MFRNRKILLPLLLIITVIIAISVYFSVRNPYGEYLTIANLSEYTSGKPTNKDILNSINRLLYINVSHNVKSKLDTDSVKDILVRKNSFKQTYDDSIKIHSVSFTVDSKSIKQSYNVKYQWAEDGKREYLEEYGTIVSCVALDKLIYGDFNCKDEQIIRRGIENYDPVGLTLPHHVESKYKIIEYMKNVDSTGTTVLQVEAYAQRGVAKIDNSTLDEYSLEINKWLTSRKLDPRNYTIEYIY